MDVIVIGKASLKSNCEPQVVYCGRSGTDARAAVAATGGKFAWVYQVNSLPIRNYKSTDFSAVAASEPIITETASTEVPAVEQTPEPEIKSKSQKKSK